jgi:hypothetical protein
MKSLYTLDRRLGGPKMGLEAIMKISVLTSFRKRAIVVQPIAGHLTDSSH